MKSFGIRDIANPFSSANDRFDQIPAKAANGLRLQTCKILHPELQLLSPPGIWLYRRVSNRKDDVLAVFAILGPGRHMQYSVVVGIEIVHERDP
jgi:hypothetical protein